MVHCVALSPDGKTLAAGGGLLKDPTVKLWDVQTGKELQAYKGDFGEVRSVAFSPDGRTLAWGGSAAGVPGDVIKLRSVATGKELQTLERQHHNAVQSVAFSPDGKTLASGSADYTIKLWDVAAGTKADK